MTAADIDPVTGVFWVYLLLYLVGVVGIVLPVLPGLVVCTLTVVIWAFDTGGTTAWVTAGVAVVLYLCGLAGQLLLPGRRMRRDGIGTGTLLLGLLAGFVGFFVVPVVGLPLFFVLAIYGLQLSRYRDASRAWAATRSAIRGVIHSMGIELSTAALIGVTWAAGILAHRW